MTDTGHRGEATTSPSRGDFRVARAEHVEPRLVLVVDVPQGQEFSTVMFVTNEVDQATEADVRVDPVDTGLAYTVLVQTDLVAPVWNSQLDPSLGTLRGDFEMLLDPAGPDLGDVESVRRGLPLAGPADPRWAWKGRELAHLHELAWECFASISDVTAGEEPFGRVASLDGAEILGVEGEVSVGPPDARWPVPIIVRDGLVAIVDLLGGDRPPQVVWDATDRRASHLADALLTDLWGLQSTDWTAVDVSTLDLSSGSASRAGRALRILALAEVRARHAPIWAIDGALATVELFDVLGLDERKSEADPSGAGLLGQFDERIRQAVDALLELPDAVRDIEGHDLLVRLELQLQPLRARMEPESSSRLDAWLAEWRGWIRPEVERRVEVAVTMPVRRRIPVAPSLALANIVHDDASAELSVDPGDEAAMIATLPLSRAAGAAARFWSFAQDASPEERRYRELERAALVLEAATGRGTEAPELWLRFFDKRTGDTVREVTLGLPDDDLQEERRPELTARIRWAGGAAAALDRWGAVVEPTRACLRDAESLLGSVLVAVVEKPEIAADFARHMEREVDSPSLKRDLLGAARAAYRLALADADSRRIDLGRAPAMVDDGLERLGESGTSAPEFPSEVRTTVASELVRRAIQAREYVAKEIAERLASRRLGDREPGRGAAVDAAIDHCRPLVDDLAALWRLMP